MTSPDPSFSTDTMGQPVPTNDAFSRFMLESATEGNRRQRENEITSYIRTAHIFTTDAKGKPVGTCRCYGCHASAKDLHMNRSCTNMVFTPWNHENPFSKKKDMNELELKQYAEFEEANAFVYCYWNGKIVKKSQLSEDELSRVMSCCDAYPQYSLASKEQKEKIDKDEEENKKKQLQDERQKIIEAFKS